MEIFFFFCPPLLQSPQISSGARKEGASERNFSFPFPPSLDLLTTTATATVITYFTAQLEIKQFHYLFLFFKCRPDYKLIGLFNLENIRDSTFLNFQGNSVINYGNSTAILAVVAETFCKINVILLLPASPPPRFLFPSSSSPHSFTVPA